MRAAAAGQDTHRVPGQVHTALGWAGRELESLVQAGP